MISHFKNIDTNIVKLGQEVKLKSDCCVITPKALVEDIIYLPPKCELEVDGHKKTIHKGYFLNVREYYLNQQPMCWFLR
jgi:hypothetical protein